MIKSSKVSAISVREGATAASAVWTCRDFATAEAEKRQGSRAQHATLTDRVYALRGEIQR